MDVSSSYISNEVGMDLSLKGKHIGCVVVVVVVVDEEEEDYYYDYDDNEDEYGDNTNHKYACLPSFFFFAQFS